MNETKDAKKIERCLRKALSKASFLVLRKYQKIPITECKQLDEMKEAIIVVLDRAERLGWIVYVENPLTEIKKVFETTIPAV